MRRGGEMQRIGIIFAAPAGIVIAQLATPQAAGQERSTLNLVTAGDQNMVDLSRPDVREGASWRYRQSRVAEDL
jgi:hypothetical protein